MHFERFQRVNEKRIGNKRKNREYPDPNTVENTEESSGELRRIAAIQIPVNGDVKNSPEVK